MSPTQPRHFAINHGHVIYIRIRFEMWRLTPYTSNPYVIVFWNTNWYFIHSNQLSPLELNMLSTPIWDTLLSTPSLYLWHSIEKRRHFITMCVLKCPWSNQLFVWIRDGEVPKRVWLVMDSQFLIKKRQRIFKS